MSKYITITPREYSNNNDLIGLYINRSLFSDVDPIGKIVSTRGTNFVTIQPVEATENKTKMEFVKGGFSFICLNQYSQKYDFYEYGEPYEVRLSKSMLKRNFWVIQSFPRKFYDYNF